MNRLAKYTLILTITLVFASNAHAEVIVYEFGNTTAKTLSGLGTKFVLGCVALALGMVGAAYICKKN